jgi:hypothetical protein
MWIYFPWNVEVNLAFWIKYVDPMCMLTTNFLSLSAVAYCKSFSSFIDLLQVQRFCHKHSYYDLHIVGIIDRLSRTKTHDLWRFQTV